MFQPCSLFLLVWNIIILLIDTFYTALWVPIVATFELPHGITSGSGAIDFFIGLLLCADIFIRFHAPIVLTSTYMSVTLTRPKAVSRFYVTHGSFVLDVLAALPLIFLPAISAGRKYLLVVLVFRILRLLRVQKVINMLFYIQMMSVSGASGWRMIIGNIVSTVYTILVICNFMACLWYWIGRRPRDGIGGWMAETYSAPPHTFQTRLHSSAVHAHGLNLFLRPASVALDTKSCVQPG
jgi:hypothetical protein